MTTRYKAKNYIINMKNTLKVWGIICLGVALFATLSSVEQNSTQTTQSQYVQNPPIAKQYWVQKIRTPDGMQGGEFSVVIKAEFEHDMPLPSALSIYKNGQVAQVLHDDGNYPDDRANDGIFATIVNQDPTVFANEVVTRMNNLQAQGYGMKFTGHLGEVVKYRDIKPFNYNDFQNFQIQQFDEIILEGATPCDMQDEILKQNSLLITDLRVVEDPARTYNVVTGAGTSQGAWTFGELMKNMAGGYADEANPLPAEVAHIREFLKQWIIEQYTQFTVNGHQSASLASDEVLQLLVRQWIRIAKNNEDYIVPVSNDQDWQTIWDTAFTTTEDINDLLAAAPFKLTAIVNRLDLRGNSGYDNGSGLEINAGETRFIYSLIHGVDDLKNGLPSDGLGGPVVFYPTSAGGHGVSSAVLNDWNGMNVIFEYSNIVSEECEIKDLGEQWKELSDYAFDDSTYLNKLESITNLVTARNARVDGVNGSAISQIRTNTKLFSPAESNAKWNLREFKLDETTGYLVNAPTANMPFAVNNTRRNSKFEGTLDIHASSEDIVDWIYGVNGPSKAISVRHGNHNIPQHLLEPTAVMQDEMQSYYGLGYWNPTFPDNIYDDHNYNLEASLKHKEIRHQLSLNTCMGCHGAETKTLFTMIRPLGYGDSANYWSPTSPSVTTGKVENVLTTINNAGTTFDNTHPDRDVNNFIDNYNLEYYQGNSQSEIRSIPNVSAFLTGRNYRTGIGIIGDDKWNDDFEAAGSDDEIHPDLGDKALEGLFYVNDPSNEANVADNEYEAPGANSNNATQPPFPQYHEKKFGFNELENRQMDLCMLTSTSCQPSSGVFDVFAHLDFVPLPLHGH